MSANSDKTCLNKNEEEKLKNALIEFVLRVSSGQGVDSEKAILPDMTKLLFEYFANYCLPDVNFNK